VADIAVVDLAPEVRAGSCQRSWLIQGQYRLFSEIIEEAVHVGIEVRRAPLGIHRNGSKGIRRSLRTQIFPRGKDHRSIQLRDGFLGGGIEEAERIDGFAEKFDTQRVGIGRRENIHNAASNTELAGDFHHRDPAITET
jgi:hypothetical protein